MDCLFCKIVNNEIPNYCFYEDDLFKVILDINPNTNGDALIVPKKHYTNIMDVDNETFSSLQKVIKEMYNLLKEKLSCQGLTITINNDLGQEIKHLHVHLTPRYDNDNMKIISNKEIIKDLKEIFDNIMLKRD